MNIQRSAAVAIALASLFAGSAVAQQQRLRIEVTNLQGAGGYYFTPLVVGFHDGSVDYFDSGDSAGDNANSTPVQLLAEGGDGSGLDALFSSGGRVTAPAGFAGAPVFDPGDSGVGVFDVDTSDRYFSFASMLIPTNDVFFGNNDPLGFELFDTNGAFVGPVDILIEGSDLYDAGTEVLDASTAAFVPGGSGAAGSGGGADENGVIRRLDDGSGAGFADFNNEFLGVETAAGTTISSNLSGGSQVARIRITAVPEPGGLTLLALGGVALIARRRRK